MLGAGRFAASCSQISVSHWTRDRDAGAASERAEEQPAGELSSWDILCCSFAVIVVVVLLF